MRPEEVQANRDSGNLTSPVSSCTRCGRPGDFLSTTAVCACVSEWKTENPDSVWIAIESIRTWPISVCRECAVGALKESLQDQIERSARSMKWAPMLIIGGVGLAAVTAVFAFMLKAASSGRVGLITLLGLIAGVGAALVGIVRWPLSYVVHRNAIAKRNAIANGSHIPAPRDADSIAEQEGNRIADSLRKGNAPEFQERFELPPELQTKYAPHWGLRRGRRWKIIPAQTAIRWLHWLTEARWLSHATEEERRAWCEAAADCARRLRDSQLISEQERARLVDLLQAKVVAV